MKERNEMNQKLLSQLDDPDPKVRRSATKELQTVVEPSVRPVWLTKLSDTDEIVRRNAVIGLGNWDDSETASAILPVLSDAALDVRCAVIEVLCKLGCRNEYILDSLRHHFWQVQQASVRVYRKHGAERREHDLLYRSLCKIDPNFETWLKGQHANKSEQGYLNMLDLTKRRIEQTDILEREATSSLLDSEQNVIIRQKAAHDLGTVYFDWYILAYIFENASELRYLPDKSLRGTLEIRVNSDFDSWVSVANVFDLRFNAAGAEPILNTLCSALNDEQDSIRYACVQVLRALKDEHSIPALKAVAKRYADTISDEGEEARDAISEIEAAARTVWLQRMTSETFGKLALELK
jgi:HEAT repeat protein